MQAMPFQSFDAYSIRPNYYPGESLVGYVYRYFAANGYRVTIGQYIVLELLYSKKPETVEKHFNCLQKALAGTKAISFERWQQNLKRNQGCVEKWGELAKRRLSFCPLCIKRRPYHLQLWELPLVKACPEHGCCLLDACSHCGRKFTWSRLLPGFECGCGKHIGDMTYVEAEAKWLNLARKIASAKDVVVPYGMGRHVSPLFALSGYKLQDIYAQTDRELEFTAMLREDVPFLLLPLSRRLAKENGINIDFDAGLQALL